MKQGDERIASVPLGFSGTSSIFEGSVSFSEPGFYDLIVYGYDQKTGNTGVARTTVRVR